jgi:hypothetical protein
MSKAESIGSKTKKKMLYFCKIMHKNHLKMKIKLMTVLEAVTESSTTLT